jgi:plastocyanin
MTKAAWIAGIVILVVALCGAYFFGMRQEVQTQPTDTGTTGNAVVGANGASTVITYTDEGFLSSPQTISPGTTVTWVNESSRLMWVESAKDRGDSCSQPGRTFDECQGVAKGGTYSYTFTTLGTFEYINHAQISDAGTIIVTGASSSGPINPGATPQ